MSAEAALSAELASLPAAHGSHPVQFDERGLVALLRDYFMGGTREAGRAADAFLRGDIAFRTRLLCSLLSDLQA